jgi:MFS family permease
VLALQLMLQLDAQVMTVAWPAVQSELEFTASSLSWVPNAYALAFGGLILLGGRLGDSYGRVRVLSIGTGVFMLGSLAGGLAFDPIMLIAARVLQGVGAAVAAPSVLALIVTIARDEAAREKGLAWFTAIAAVGSSAGLILGGC